MNEYITHRNNRAPYFAGLFVFFLYVIPSDAAAHDNKIGYLQDCVDLFLVPRAIPGDETSPRGFGIFNKCAVDIVAIACSKDRFGNLNRWDDAKNLAPGAKFSWTVHDESNFGGAVAFSCKPGATCAVGEHDPHCHL